MVLELTHNQARRNSNLAGEFYYLDAVKPKAQHGVDVLSRYESMFGEVVGLVLLFGLGSVHAFDEHALIAVKEKVPRFVEESEPKLIVSKMAEAQNQQCFLWRQELCGATGPTAVWRPHNRESHAIG